MVPFFPGRALSAVPMRGSCPALSPLLPGCTQLPPPQGKTLALPLPLPRGGSAWEPPPRRA